MWGVFIIQLYTTINDFEVQHYQINEMVKITTTILWDTRYLLKVGTAQYFHSLFGD